MISKVIMHNTTAYWEAVNLRDKILRKPLGLQFSKEELLAENEQIHIVGYLDKKIIASLSLIKQVEGKLKMRQVCVDNEIQSKGYGQLLVGYSEQWGKENGFTTMYCHAREIACAFYEKMNYQKIGDLFTEVNIPHYKMEKRLI
ncbi:MAG: GNAT family N-acetyltransferase [Chitinophagales bacterium]